MTGSRMFMLGEAMSILARSVSAAVGELARAHALEQVQVLVDGAVAERAVLAGLRRACRDRRAICSAFRSQTYALPLRISSMAHS